MSLKDISLKGHFKYALHLDDTHLPNNAIQKTYLGSKYIYALVRHKTDSVIYRALIPSEGSVINFNQNDHMTLKNFGHGQTLDWFPHNKHDGKGTQPFFWVVGKEAGDNPYFGIQVGRIHYVKNYSINYNQMTRLSGLNKTFINDNALYRCDSALSPNHSKMALYTVPKNSHTSARLTLFNFNQLNDVLDEVEKNGSNYISVGSAKVQNTILRDPFDFSTLELLNHSMQGMALSNGESIYITSGDAYSNQQPAVAKIGWYGSPIKKKYIDIASVKNPNNLEIEAPKLSGDLLLFGIVVYGKNNRKYNRIYTINKNNV